MANRSKRRSKILILSVVITLVWTLSPGAASSDPTWSSLDRWDPTTPSPTGQSVAVECNDPGMGEPETWPKATARLRLNERNGRTRITFDVRDARPDTLYTVWVRLLGVDSEGESYGGSPLTGIPVTPLVPSADLPDQLARTLPNPGDDQGANGFRTNRRGKGRLTIQLDFPIASGAYPFQRFPDFESLKDDVALTNPANVARLGGSAASIRPVAITDGSQAPATILIASHCVDDIAHGLLPGPHENWFTWSLD